jgi:hypothetical protein
VEINEFYHSKQGFRLGISVSQSEDLGTLGLTETHLRMALGEIARAMLMAEGQILYGGNLDPDGYTSFLVRECERFQSRNRPFVGYISWSEHRRMTLTAIRQEMHKIGLLGRYVFLDMEGQDIDPFSGRGESPEEVNYSSTIIALSALRRRLTSESDARILLGGKRRDYAGRLPGVIEEAALCIGASKPLFIAGGFGGAAADAVATLGLDPDDWLRLPDRQANADLSELEQVVAARKWDPETNGLTVEQNRRLAVTYRASEIASLVIQGVNRIVK